MTIHNVLYDVFGIASTTVTNSQRCRDKALKETNVEKTKKITSEMVEILKSKLIQYRDQDSTLGLVLFSQQIQELKRNSNEATLSNNFIPQNYFGDLMGHCLLEVEMLKKNWSSSKPSGRSK